MVALDIVEGRARELVHHHLGADWRFGFDRAKQRAGACHYATRTITLSKHLALRQPLADVEQTVLHEIAHALAGHAAGHGPQWRAAARRIGYRGGRTHQGPVAAELAPWVGLCPAGHAVYRFRTPDARRPVSCARCHRGFDRAYLIRWSRRSDEELEAARRQERAAVGANS